LALEYATDEAPNRRARSVVAQRRRDGGLHRDGDVNSGAHRVSLDKQHSMQPVTMRRAIGPR
jgi:hypothetical protein